MDFVPFDLSAWKQADKHGEERHKAYCPADRSLCFRWKRIKVAQGLTGPEQGACKSVRSALPTSRKVPLGNRLNPVR
jgi:hypothetical protein